MLDKTQLRTITLDAGSATPLYAQVAKFLGSIVREHFADGEMFFPEVVLVDNLPVSQVTIRRAMSELADQKLVQRTRGRGTVVTKNLSAKSLSMADIPRDELRNIGRPASQLKIVGIYRPAHEVVRSEHATALMSEFQRQCEILGLECRYYDASTAQTIMRSFTEIDSNPAEEGFVLHTRVEETPMLYHSLAHRGYRSVAMEGASEAYSGWVVETDAAEAMRIGIGHLTDLGHRRIVLLVNEPATEPTVVDKIQAFQEASASKGIVRECRVIYCNGQGNNSYEVAYNSMRDALGAKPNARPTAIMTVSDPGAWAALKWCSQHGINVPNELSILGFEDVYSSQYMIPAVSSLSHPREMLVNTVLDVLAGDLGETPRRILVPPILMARESTGEALMSKSAPNRRVPRMAASKRARVPQPVG